MWFSISVIVGVAIGMVAGGWSSISLARDYDFRRARGVLRRGALVAALVTMLLHFFLLGWPYKAAATEEAASGFSFWLLLPMAAGGVLAYFAELWCVRLVWRWRG